MASIFTKIINKELPGHIIDENQDFIAFLDINPLTIGHSLIVPKREIDYFFDLDDKILRDIQNVTNVDDWKFSSFRHSLPKDFNRDNILANVTLDRAKYKAVFMNPTITPGPPEPTAESIKKRMKFLVNY